MKIVLNYKQNNRIFVLEALQSFTLFCLGPLQVCNVFGSSHIRKNYHFHQLLLCIHQVSFKISVPCLRRTSILLWYILSCSPSVFIHLQHTEARKEEGQGWEREGEKEEGWYVLITFAWCHLWILVSCRPHLSQTLRSNVICTCWAVPVFAEMFISQTLPGYPPRSKVK